MDAAALEALVVRAIDGDKVALRVVLTGTRRVLRDFVASKIPRDCQHLFDADDIVQTTHMSIFRNIGSVRSTHPGSFHRWIRAIALNRLRNAINAYRAAKRDGARQRCRVAPPGFEDSTVALFQNIAAGGRRASQDVAREEAVSLMEAAMAKLPHHYRQALVLVHLEGLPVRDAAAVMDRTDRAVHGLCRRGLRQLEIQLGTVSKYLSSSG